MENTFFDETEAEKRERVLQQLVREYRQRHKLDGLSEVIRIQGEPTLREKALREFGQQEGIIPK